MTTRFLATDIAWDEAPRGVPVLHAYGDPLTKGPPWTIGFGSTGPDVHSDSVWDAQACVDRRDRDIREAVNGLSQRVAEWGRLSAERQDVLVNMAYQMGVEGVMGFKNMLALVAQGRWTEAAQHMRASLWHKQTPNRAERLAIQMETGVRVPRPYDNTIAGAVPVLPPKEGIVMSLISSAFHFVFDHAFAAAARDAATANPVSAAAGIAAVQVTSMLSEGSPNSTAGQASPLVRQLEDDLNAVVANFVKAGVDQLPIVGGIAAATGLDQRAADAAKAMLVMGEQHALTYLSALFSGHHIAVNAVTVPTSNGGAMAPSATGGQVQAS